MFKLILLDRRVNCKEKESTESSKEQTEITYTQYTCHKKEEEERLTNVKENAMSKYANPYL